MFYSNKAVGLQSRSLKPGRCKHVHSSVQHYPGNISCGPFPAVRLEVKLSNLEHLSSGLAKLFDQQLHTDVTFLVSGQRVRAHRALLASQSAYFECLLYGPMMEGSSSEITLEDTPEEAFRELLRYLYSGTVSSVNLTVSTLCIVYYLTTMIYT